MPFVTQPGDQKHLSIKAHEGLAESSMSAA